LQPLNQSGCAQRCGRTLVASSERRRARRRPNQGNLLRLTDNLDRQQDLLFLVEKLFRPAGTLGFSAPDNPIGPE
jgi:hypothetical protein